METDEGCFGSGTGGSTDGCNVRLGAAWPARAVLIVAYGDAYVPSCCRSNNAECELGHGLAANDGSNRGVLGVLPKGARLGTRPKLGGTLRDRALCPKRSPGQKGCSTIWSAQDARDVRISPPAWAWTRCRFNRARSAGQRQARLALLPLVDGGSGGEGLAQGVIVRRRVNWSLTSCVTAGDGGAGGPPTRISPTLRSARHHGDGCRTTHHGRR